MRERTVIPALRQGSDSNEAAVRNLGQWARSLIQQYFKLYRSSDNSNLEDDIKLLVKSLLMRVPEVSVIPLARVFLIMTGHRGCVGGSEAKFGNNSDTVKLSGKELEICRG